MKIVALSDVESKALWDHYDQNRLTDADLIISCGDLNAEYLRFLVTCANIPLLYVHGNHDSKYDTNPPDGCICIDDKIYVHNGIRILGLGGCVPYKPGPHMYSEKDMEKRIRKLKRQLRKHGGFDILVTHAPLHGIGDGDDMPHRGYEAFFPLLDQYKPKYMLHGHMHLQYSPGAPRIRMYQDTQVVNAYERYDFEY